jgi:hypothetical protein
MLSFIGYFRRIFVSEINTPIALFSDAGTKVDLQKFRTTLSRDGDVNFCFIPSIAHYQEIDTTVSHEYLVVTIVVGTYNSNRTTTRHVIMERLPPSGASTPNGDDGNSPTISHDFATVSARESSSFPLGGMVKRINIGEERQLTLRKFLNFIAVITPPSSDPGSIQSSSIWFCWVIMYFISQTCVAVTTTYGPTASDDSNMTREEKAKSYEEVFDRYVDKYPDESTLDKALNEVKLAAAPRLQSLSEQLEEARRSEARLLAQLAEAKSLSQ